MADYQKELEKYQDVEGPEKSELQKLASMQKDIAVAGSAEDFIRHPFFKFFENKMNDMIADSKNKIMSLETIKDLKAHQSAIKAIVDLKAWLNGNVMKGRVAAQAIEMYEKDTETMNAKIQEAIDQSAIQ